MNEKREVILDVRGLKQYFKLGSGKKRQINKAVNDVSFKIYKGEVFSLVGESGCGKTTTGRTIIKLYKATGGEVYFNGTRIISDIGESKRLARKMIAEAKETYKNTLEKLNEELNDNIISKETFNDSKASAKADLKHEKALAKDIVVQAENDDNFENIKTKTENVKKLSSREDYKELDGIYRKENIALQEHARECEITYNKANETFLTYKDSEDKDKVKELKLELKQAKKALQNAEREIVLNEKRQTLDIKNLSYQLKHRNKFLMRSMQMIFQDPIASLNPRMTVKEIIAEGLRINGVKNEAYIDKRVKEALTTVGLVAEHAGRYPHEFSGGQRQRIGIARSLVVNPSFIIADEPISALDVSIRAQVINLLNDLRNEKGITIMFIAHDLSVVKYFSDRLAVMYFGKIVEMGDKDKIFNNPLHPYTLSLLESIPLPDPHYEQNRKRTERYNPAKEHDYSKEEPTLREIEPNHFVLCNTEEFEKYQKIVTNEKNN
jgi:ABC-type oligopeptide transport system ATPase subunit